MINYITHCTLSVIQDIFFNAFYKHKQNGEEGKVWHLKISHIIRKSLYTTNIKVKDIILIYVAL